MSSIPPLPAPAMHVRTTRHVGVSVRIRNMARSHSSPPMTNRCAEMAGSISTMQLKQRQRGAPQQAAGRALEEYDATS